MFCSLSLQYFTGLECGHKFCMQCWSEYLTTKIMEEGMGQVKCQLVYPMSSVNSVYWEGSSSLKIKNKQKTPNKTKNNQTNKKQPTKQHRKTTLFFFLPCYEIRWPFLLYFLHTSADAFVRICDY